MSGVRQTAGSAGALTLAALMGWGGLSSCTVGPRFEPPHEPVAESYAGPGGDPSSGEPRAAPEAESDAFWWRQFHDQKLEDLEKRAAQGNLDLKSAYLRIVEARLQELAARAQGLPNLNASAAFTREQLGLAGVLKSQGITSNGTLSASTDQLIRGIEAPVNLYQLGFDASWELDLFGRVRRSVEAAEAESAGAAESRNDLLVSLEAEVAQDYFQLRGGQMLRQAALELIAAQREVLDLTIDRRKHGLAGDADVDSARGQLASLESQLPADDQTIATARHALAVLVGVAPESFDEDFGASGTLPPLPATIPVGVPSTLARRRPDIRGAEDSLHEATAEIGVAVAALFPDVSLSGTYGLRNTGTRYLFDWSSNFYTYGPKISIPIFHGGALVSNVRLARATAAAAAFSYRKTVLSALQEVEDGLSQLHTDAERTHKLDESLAAEQAALDVDLDAYRHGILSYLQILELQIQVTQARLQLVQAELTQSGDLVKLYKALGGGWEDAPNAGYATAAIP
jgi:NodT family efflux transporter outer membrane factor (OMF) lipoprotein